MRATSAAIRPPRLWPRSMTSKSDASCGDNLKDGMREMKHQGWFCWKVGKSLTTGWYHLEPRIKVSGSCSAGIFWCTQHGSRPARPSVGHGLFSETDKNCPPTPRNHGCKLGVACAFLGAWEGPSYQRWRTPGDISQGCELEVRLATSGHEC
jgi:hypothetical protein